MNQTLKDVFKQGSTTYFYGSIFFPEPIKTKVFQLYAFVRIIDDFVDQNPPDTHSFYRFVVVYAQLSGHHVTQLDRLKNLDQLEKIKIDLTTNQLTETQDIVLKNFVELKNEMNFPGKWIQAFLTAMEADIYKSTYQSKEELLAYMYGSAEVVGLCMAKILQLPDSAQSSAKLLGRSMQYINFIRDVAEDVQLGRQYLPKHILRKWHLTSLEREIIQQHPELYKNFIKEVSNQYKEWQSQAEKGYDLIPLRYLLPIKTASDMYNWTIDEVVADPQKAYKQKIKPSKCIILCSVIKNFFQLAYLRWL